MIEEVRKAMEVLRNGGLLLVQTDTGWELACDATDEKAVERLIALRKTKGKPNVVLVDSPVKIEFYVRDVPEIAWDLLEVADKPLVVVFPEIRNLPASLLSEDGSLGIRLAGSGFSKLLCERYRKALFCASPDRNHQPAPSALAEIDPEILQAVDYVVQQSTVTTKQISPSVIRLGKGGQVQILKP